MTVEAVLWPSVREITFILTTPSLNIQNSPGQNKEKRAERRKERKEKNRSLLVTLCPIVSLHHYKTFLMFQRLPQFCAKFSFRCRY